MKGAGRAGGESQRHKGAGFAECGCPAPGCAAERDGPRLVFALGLNCKVKMEKKK